MLQSIREFARDRLAGRNDAAAVRRRHVDYFLCVAKPEARNCGTKPGRRAPQQLSAEAPDIRSALLGQPN
jgi:hypothetical protein